MFCDDGLSALAMELLAETFLRPIENGGGEGKKAGGRGGANFVPTDTRLKKLIFFNNMSGEGGGQVKWIVLVSSLFSLVLLSFPVALFFSSFTCGRLLLAHIMHLSVGCGKTRETFSATPRVPIRHGTHLWERINR